MIAYVDTPPIVDSHGDGFLFTFRSGEEAIQLMLTPHAAFYLREKINKAKAEAAVAALDKEPIKFRKRKGRR